MFSFCLLFELCDDLLRQAFPMIVSILVAVVAIIKEEEGKNKWCQKDQKTTQQQLIFFQNYDEDEDKKSEASKCRVDLNSKN